MLGERVPGRLGRDPEVVPLLEFRVLVRDRAAGRREHGPIEAAARPAIGDPDRDVVEHARIVRDLR
jgi:hypothetical protein